MRALFVHDHYYYTDGDVTLSKGQYHHSLWGRYLSHFDGLTVIGRDAGKADRRENGINISSQGNVAFELFQNTNSLRGKLLGQRDLQDKIADLVATHDVIILRGISELGILAFHAAKSQGKYVAFEIVSCAFDELWYHGSSKAKIYSLYRFFKQRQLARNADAVIYVSQDFLQHRYPTRAPLIARASNVHVPDTDYFQKAIKAKTVCKIGMIGTLKNKLKGVHVAIEAAACLKAQGVGGFTIHILGPGDPAPFQKMIQDKGLQDIVFLDGIRESGEGVWRWLRDLDVYIQPSFQEGVPRATIEAMAQGLPVIGSNAGGIPELLDDAWIFKRGNANALADKIKAMIDATETIKTQGNRNFAEAQQYHADKLSSIRHNFWSTVKTVSKNK